MYLGRAILLDAISAVVTAVAVVVLCFFLSPVSPEELHDGSKDPLLDDASLWG